MDGLAAQRLLPICYPCHHDIIKIKSQHHFGHVHLNGNAGARRGRCPFLQGQSQVPGRQHHRDDGRAVCHGVRVIHDVYALSPRAMDHLQRLICRAPGPGTHKYQMGILQLHACLPR